MLLVLKPDLLCLLLFSLSNKQQTCQLSRLWHFVVYRIIYVLWNRFLLNICMYMETAKFHINEKYLFSFFSFLKFSVFIYILKFWNSTLEFFQSLSHLLLLSMPSHSSCWIDSNNFNGEWSEPLSSISKSKHSKEKFNIFWVKDCAAYSQRKRGGWFVMVANKQWLYYRNVLFTFDFAFPHFTWKLHAISNELGKEFVMLGNGWSGSALVFNGLCLQSSFSISISMMICITHTQHIGLDIKGW